MEIYSLWKDWASWSCFLRSSLCSWRLLIISFCFSAASSLLAVKVWALCMSTCSAFSLASSALISLIWFSSSFFSWAYWVTSCLVSSRDFSKALMLLTKWFWLSARLLSAIWREFSSLSICFCNSLFCATLCSRSFMSIFFLWSCCYSSAFFEWVSSSFDKSSWFLLINSSFSLIRVVTCLYWAACSYLSSFVVSIMLFCKSFLDSSALAILLR